MPHGGGTVDGTTVLDRRGFPCLAAERAGTVETARLLLPGPQFVVAFCNVTVAVRVAPEVSVHVTFMESPG